MPKGTTMKARFQAIYYDDQAMLLIDTEDEDEEDDMEDEEMFLERGYPGKSKTQLEFLSASTELTVHR
jgi:hypothetical protein